MSELISPIDCRHRHINLLHGSRVISTEEHSRSNVYLCLDCGQFMIRGMMNGQYYSIDFTLMEQKYFEEIKRNFYSLLPEDRIEDMADLIAEVERLQQEITLDTLLLELMKELEERNKGLSNEVERLQILNQQYRQALLESGWQEGKTNE